MIRERGELQRRAGNRIIEVDLRVFYAGDARPSVEQLNGQVVRILAQAVPFFLRPGLPHPDSTIFTRRGDTAAIGAECNVRNRTPISSASEDKIVVHPDFHKTVTPGNRELPTVWAECEIGGKSERRRDLLGRQQLPGLGFPYEQRVKNRCGYANPLTVGAESGSVDVSKVALATDELARGRVPHVERPVSAGEDDPGSVWMETARHAARGALIGSDYFATVIIPDLDAIAPDRGDLSVGRKIAKHLHVINLKAATILL
jgi:hypothetical protein